MQGQTSTYDQHPPDREYGPTVLIVDDEPQARDRLRLALLEVEDSESLHILHSTTVQEAIHIVAGTPVHVVLLDKNLGPNEADPAHNGIDAIPEMLKLQPHLQILMVTGSDDVQDVVRAMKYGACGYIVKGTSGDLLITHINRAIDVAVLKLDKIRRDRRENHSQMPLGGESRVFREILRQAQLLAESNRPVLLLGETGTGKSELARWINQCRARYLKQKDRPFFAVNVATLSKDLAESELFGHEKGAFTDASQQRQGLFELTNNGTLFLDEIGELSLDLQAKLLTVIEDGTFLRVGGTQVLRSSPKLIFATNRNLEEMVRLKLFREDLFMRISMFPLTLPPLSERREDIPAIVKCLLGRVSRELEIEVAFSEIPRDFIESLCSSDLDGNIRGLRNQLDRLLVLAPRDKSGKPILERWRSVPGLLVRRSERRGSEPDRAEPISLKDLLIKPLALMSADFPGIDALTELITDRLIDDLRASGISDREIAERLGKSKTWMAVQNKRRQFGQQVLSGHRGLLDKGVVQ